MAAPRVFISSTYYDLKQVRNNIGDFIKNLGYEPVMHERSGVAYTQTEPLEYDCYHELASCDIVVCIIGNHFGSKSYDNELSITMNELKTAIKNKKKIYVFISNDVYIENRIYKKNKESGTFVSAYADDIKIHEYIEELTETTKNHVITPFETTEQIISVLKSQFAGLFQNLLQKEASATEAKTVYDLQESADNMRAIIADFQKEKDEFFTRFEGTAFKLNGVVLYLKDILKIKDFTFFVKDADALDEFMRCIGYAYSEVDDPFEDCRKYVHVDGVTRETLILKNGVFDENGKIKDIRKKEVLNQYIIHRIDVDEEDITYEDLPF